MPLFLSEEELKTQGQALNKRRGHIVKKTYLADISAFPDVRHLFKKITERGIKIALASSAKKDELAVYKRKADIEDLVQKEPSSDDVKRSKPHGDIFQAALDQLPGIDPSETLVVGDTPYDAEAAAKVGIKTIGVLCGGFPESELWAAGCIAIYRDPTDMLAQLDEILML